MQKLMFVDGASQLVRGPTLGGGSLENIGAVMHVLAILILKSSEMVRLKMTVLLE